MNLLLYENDSLMIMKKIATATIVFSVVAVVLFLSYQQTMFEVKKVVHNDVTLWTESFGDSSKPAMLLVAGAGAPCRFWHDSFCQKLTQYFFVIRYDHRDTGFSTGFDYEKKPYTLNDLADDALNVLDSYGIKKAHIVGHSMGGYLAQLLALDFPKNLRVVMIVVSVTNFLTVF